MRIDICASDDYATRERLVVALVELGAAPDDDGDALGVGLYRFRVGFDTLTVFIDAWQVDIEGPDALVQQVLQFISER